MSFRNIIIFGAGGNKIGNYVLNALVDDGSFTVTVLARESSTTTYPESVKVIKVDDHFHHKEVVEALKGQDVLISMSGLGAAHQQYKIIDAAIEAGVKRFVPSEWGFDNSDPKNQELCPIFYDKGEIEKYLKTKESSSFSWTAIACGIWLEWYG